MSAPGNTATNKVFAGIDTVPVIENIRAKIATLERRCDHLTRKLEKPEYAASASADWDRAERDALRAAILALRYCENVN